MRSFLYCPYVLFAAFLCLLCDERLSAQCESYNCQVLPAPFNSVAGIVPTCVAGSPTACTIAGRPGFRIQSNNSGTFYLNAKYGEHTACNGTVNPSDTLNAFSIDYNPGLHTFSWSVTNALLIEQVIVRGGPNTLIYNYAGNSRSSDANLHAPVNPANCRYYPVQSVEITYRYQLSVVHTVRPVYTRTFNWTIAQSVTPASWTIFNGDRATARYTVALDQTGFSDSGWGVSGNIEVRNNTPLSAQIVAMTDTIRPGIVGINNIACGTTAFTLVPGGVLQCTFSAPLPDAAARTATLQVTTFGLVRGRTVATPFTFGAPSTQVNAAVNVTDTNGQNRSSIQKDSTYTYDRLLTCSNQGNYVNTATIVETGQKAAATVGVQCFSPQVTHSTSSSFDRQWDWMVSMKSKQKDIVLSTGQYYRSAYEATVEGKVQSRYAMQGSVTVRNPHPTRTMNVPSLLVTLTGNITVPVTCPTQSIAPGGQLTCTFGTSLPDGAARTALIAVNQQNYTYPLTGNPIPGGGTRTSSSASIVFPIQPVSETDECAVLYRDSSGVKIPIDTLCSLQGAVEYSERPYIGPYTSPDQCDTHQVHLTVGIQGLESLKSVVDAHSFSVIVPCNTGCTLSQNYWNNHAQNGIAVYDDNWLQLGDADSDGQKEGENETFYQSGRTYWNVLNTPNSSNPYWNLAKAFIAADLNVKNGADPSVIQTTYNAALVLLQTYSPGQVPTLPAVIRKNFILFANALERFNNGTSGPGSCSDEADIVDERPEGAGERGREPVPFAEMNVYPNPAADRVFVQVAYVETEAPVDVRVFDMRGAVILTGQINGITGNAVLDTDKLLGGIYVVMVQFPNGTAVYRKLTIAR